MRTAPSATRPSRATSSSARSQSPSARSAATTRMPRAAEKISGVEKRSKCGRKVAARAETAVANWGGFKDGVLIPLRT